MQQRARTTNAMGRQGALPVMVWMVFSIAALILPGCRGNTAAPAGDGQPAAIAADAANYQLKGIVIASDAVKGEVSVDSEAIPGFMGAMIMPYKLAQPGIATELHPGDHITARLRVSSSTAVIDQIVVTAQAKPDYKPSMFYNVPAPGQQVPDFKFLNQNAQTIGIDQFRGKALLVTFIYTRCPLPDFCIRMSRNFATIEHALATDPQLYDKTHLLSVSFDPAYDTPKVLRSYGGAYIGEHADQTFSHWDFAAPPPSELDAVEKFFDVGVSPGSGNTLSHSLSTVVITTKGKVFQWYPNNDWSPAGVVADLKQAVTQ